MWTDKTSIYQIYPLGFCGAPYENDGVQEHRILKVTEWIPHLEKLGMGAVLFNPLFESDRHGYDTRDYRKIDVRLGTNDDFKEVCGKLHDAGIRVILDGVFNHVGRGFWAFEDVRRNGSASEYSDWFNISFDGNDAFDDGFWYEGWEGCYDLVKLNLRSESLISYLFDCVKYWIEEFGIDGLRLDVAYCLDRDFIRRLRLHVDGLKDGFYLLGEMIGGNYNDICKSDMCDSATNYECYKGLFSAFNSMNLFEIIHSVLRQQSIYKEVDLYNFADNHDVSRIANILDRAEHLPLLYVMLFMIPGIPSVYYGSEWGIEGVKKYGDHELRPCIASPEWNSLTDLIAKLADIRRTAPALRHGSFSSLLLTNRQCVFERTGGGDRLLICINADENSLRAHFDARSGMGADLLSGGNVDFGGGLEIPAYTAMVIRPEHP